MPIAFPSHRLLRDGAFLKTANLPASGASNQTPGTFDLGIGPWHPEQPIFEISIPAMAANTDPTKSVTITLQDSADGLSFANLKAAEIITISGVAITGSPASTQLVGLPPGARQYVQFVQAVTSGAADLTASGISYQMLF